VQRRRLRYERMHAHHARVGIPLRANTSHNNDDDEQSELLDTLNAIQRAADTEDEQIKQRPDSPKLSTDPAAANVGQEPPQQQQQQQQLVEDTNCLLILQSMSAEDMFNVMMNVALKCDEYAKSLLPQNTPRSAKYARSIFADNTPTDNNNNDNGHHSSSSKIRNAARDTNISRKVSTSIGNVSSNSSRKVSIDNHKSSSKSARILRADGSNSRSSSKAVQRNAMDRSSGKSSSNAAAAAAAAAAATRATSRPGTEASAIVCISVGPDGAAPALLCITTAAGHLFLQALPDYVKWERLSRPSTVAQLVNVPIQAVKGTIMHAQNWTQETAGVLVQNARSLADDALVELRKGMNKSKIAKGVAGWLGLTKNNDDNN